MTDKQSGSRSFSGELDDKTRTFIEDFASSWELANNARMEGRVLGLLMIVDEPYLSSAQIGQLLQASTGAVSMATRSLVIVGFLKRHNIPGDRAHYFRVEDDVWGTFLSGEREYLRRMKGAITGGLGILDSEAASPRTRLRNAERYMTWLEGYHRKMLLDWEAYRDAHENDHTTTRDETP
ncbi:GbsR/MarR family transcriptional regulator [Arthrobacter sp. NPDC092385]|uniref:GbsR/MarR family transcriptional regulator n=1 Tax=Arthrobacter sp. NPDC092385 TaxID=3363943 RepID=UPI0038274CD3